MAGKKKNNTIWILLGIVLLIVIAGKGSFFLGASVAQGGTSEIVRGFSSTSADYGDEILVTLDVTVGQDADCSPNIPSFCNDFFVLDEVISSDATITSLSDPAHCEIIPQSPQRLVCIFLQDTISETISYSLIMPYSPADITVSGTYMFQGDTSVNPVVGPTNIIVGTGGACEESWTCTSWSEWTSLSEACGARERTCEDSSNCGTTIDKPDVTELKTCTDSICGNSVAEAGEVCDGTDLNGVSCESLSVFSGGNLGCLPNCAGYDTYDCLSSGGGANKDACVSVWDCDEWNSCSEGVQSRICTDKSNCAVPTNPPETEVSCESKDLKWIYVGLGLVVLFYFYTKQGKGSRRKKR